MNQRKRSVRSTHVWRLSVNSPVFVRSSLDTHYGTAGETCSKRTVCHFLLLVEQLTDWIKALIGDAQRNLIMMQSSTRTFLNHYLSNHITHDTTAIICRHAPQQNIMGQTVGTGRWRDQRRPIDLDDSEKGMIQRTPEYQELRMRLVKARDGLKSAPKGQQVDLRQRYRKLERAADSLKKHLMRQKIAQGWSRFRMNRP